MTCKINADTTDGLKIVSDTSGAVDVQSNGTTRMTVLANGNVGIGATSPTTKLDIAGSMLVDAYNNGGAGSGIFLRGGFLNTAQPSITVADHNGSAPDGISINGNDGVSFRTADVERARFDASGNFVVGNTNINPTASNVTGVAVRTAGVIIVNGNATNAAAFGRSNDGAVVLIYSAGSNEGSISVSGTTVSFNGGHLSRWGRLPDDSKPTILKGTVMSNLDAMVVWDYPDELYTEEDKDENQIPEGKSIGDVKKAAYTAANEQRNQIKISDAEGDIDVAGLFVKWDTETDGFNDIDLAMTGDMVVRIAQGTTVQRGDLLMSAGDGTAKPQDDDIVRSKTIAKVTSTTVSNTYDDGSYVVPCVIMAC